jgi:predicted membrane protein
MTLDEVIIYKETYYTSQKIANQKYYDANKLSISEKRKQKLIALKENKEAYEQYKEQKRVEGKQFYYAKKTKLGQQNKTVEILKLDDLNES